MHDWKNRAAVFKYDGKHRFFVNVSTLRACLSELRSSQHEREGDTPAKKAPPGPERGERRGFKHGLTTMKKALSVLGNRALNGRFTVSKELKADLYRLKAVAKLHRYRWRYEEIYGAEKPKNRGNGRWYD